MLFALSTAFFLAMASVAALIGYWVWSRSAPAAAPAAARPGTVGPIAPAHVPVELPGWTHRLYKLGLRWQRSEAEGRVLRRLLVSAGFRDDWAVVAVQGLRVLTTVTLPILTAVILYSLNPDIMSIGPVVLCAGYIGFRLPEMVLHRLTQNRRSAVRRGLPDLLDLLVISIESGLSLDSAIATTAEDLAVVHPVLTDELSVFQYDMRAGTSHAEALRNLGKRTHEAELRKLTSLLIQADRFGTSISKVLRTQARYLRLRRRQSAEEMAHKVGVKLVFPIFFLIMPSMFLVTAGPAMIQLFGSIGKLVNGM